MGQPGEAFSHSALWSCFDLGLVLVDRFLEKAQNTPSGMAARVGILGNFFHFHFPYFPARGPNDAMARIAPGYMGWAFSDRLLGHLSLLLLER